jgi:hypothetical protein
MHRSVIAAMCVVALSAVSCSSSSGPDAERVSDREYARAVCTTLLRRQSSEGAFAAAHSALDASDAAAFRTDALELLDRYVDRLRRARTKLARIDPDTATRASDAFDEYLAVAIRRLHADAREFADADVHSPEFQAAVSTFEANLQFLAHQLPDPFARLRDRSLLAAVRTEPACADLVTIHGA